MSIERAGIAFARAQEPQVGVLGPAVPSTECDATRLMTSRGLALPWRPSPMPLTPCAESS